MRGYVRSNLATIAVGIGALVLGTIAGWSGDVAGIVVGPPPLVRVLLAAAAGAIGVAWLLQAVDRLSSSREPAVLIRGVRLVFLAVAGFAAAAGWLLGHPLPIVVALVIAGVDVVETTFLLIVVAARGPDERA